MKKLRVLYAVAIVCLLAVASSLSGCRNDKGVEEIASAQDLLVMNVNLHRLFENAGCVGADGAIELSEPVNRTLSSMSKPMARTLRMVAEAQGVDLSQCVVAVDSQLCMVASLPITDKKAFAQLMQEAIKNGDLDCEASRDGDCDVYTFDRSFAMYAIGKGLYCVQSISHQTVDIEALKAKLQTAATDALTDWQKEKLSKGNAANLMVNVAKVNQMASDRQGYNMLALPALQMAYDTEALSHSYVCIDATLDGLQADIQAHVYDTAGKALPCKLTETKIDAQLLTLVRADDQLVGMWATPDNVDWKALIESMLQSAGYRPNSQMVAQLAEYIEYADGTVLVAGRPKTPLLRSIQDVDYIVAAQLKPGKAKEVMDTITRFVNAKNAQIRQMCAPMGLDASKYLIDMTNSQDALSVKVGDFEIYVKREGETLIVSNDPIGESGKGRFGASIFDGQNIGLAVRTDKGEKIASLISLPFGVDASITCGASDMGLKIKLAETDGALLENILNLIAG